MVYIYQISIPKCCVHNSPRFFGKESDSPVDAFSIFYLYFWKQPDRAFYSVL